MLEPDGMYVVDRGETKFELCDRIAKLAAGVVANKDLTDAESKILRMRGNSLYGKREIP